MEATRIKGVVLSDLHHALVEVAGEEAVRAAIAGLEGPERREWEEAVAMSWVRIVVIEQVIHGVARRVGRDVVALNRDMNRIAADRSVRSLLRLVLKLASPAMVISRATVAYGRAYDRGRLAVRLQGEDKALVELRGRPGMTALARDGFAIAVETVLKLSGATSVRVSSAGHMDGADYTITWHA